VLSVVYCTNRSPNCINGPIVNQYRLLSYSLLGQTLPPGLWELIIVSKDGARQPELDWCGSRVRYARQRPTPWGDAFNPAAARNTGLALAQGDTVFGLDDGTSFGPKLLEVVVRYATQGQYLAPVWKLPNEVRAPDVPQVTDLCGGLVAYPRAAAIAHGGHEELFAGTLAIEDWAFSRRLAKAGVRFLCDPALELHVVTHPTVAMQRPCPDPVRCCYAVDGLTREHARANQPWTPAEIEFAFAGPTCGFCKLGPCTVTGRPCERPKPADRPPDAAVKIMHDYEGQEFGPFRGPG
jgi:hypothetical protein